MFYQKRVEHKIVLLSLSISEVFYYQKLQTLSKIRRGKGESDGKQITT